MRCWKKVHVWTNLNRANPSFNVADIASCTISWMPCCRETSANLSFWPNYWTHCPLSCRIVPCRIPAVLVLRNISCILVLFGVIATLLNSHVRMCLWRVKCMTFCERGLGKYQLYLDLFGVIPTQLNSPVSLMNRLHDIMWEMTQGESETGRFLNTGRFETRGDLKHGEIWNKGKLETRGDLKHGEIWNTGRFERQGDAV